MSKLKACFISLICSIGFIGCNQLHEDILETTLSVYYAVLGIRLEKNMQG